MTPPFVATHDRSVADYQTQWNTLVPQGYRPISLSIYGAPTAPLLAASWVKRPGPRFAGIHAASREQLRTFYDTYAAQGFSLTLLTATGPADAPCFAAVMEQLPGAAPNALLIDLSSGPRERAGTLQQALARGYDANRIPKCVAAYGSPSDRRFAVVLEPNANRSLWTVTGPDGDSAAEHQARFDAQASQWARPAFVTVTPDQRYVSVFREDSLGPWIARHDMTSAGYQAEATKAAAQGFYPAYVQASGVGAGTRFAALFVKQDQPHGRTFRTRGPAAPAFAAVDAKIRQFMRGSGTRAMGLAVVRGGRLVHARAYTWAEPDYPAADVAAMYRIASCTKPVTITAIYQLIQAGQLKLDDTVQSILQLAPPPGQALDPHFAKITIRHLLTHSGGWNRNIVSDLPSVEDVAKAFGQHTLPVSKRQVAQCAARKLQFVPGQEAHYSNVGFLLLGLVVEAKRGMPYEDAVRKYVWQPLGLTRPHRTPVAHDAQRPGAVRHHDADAPYGLRVVPSAVRGDPLGARPVAALPYGGEDYALFDAFGGWCMAPADYVKFLAALPRANNPVLDPKTTGRMWDTSTDPGWHAGSGKFGTGWNYFAHPGEAGVQHGGAMPGVSTRVLYRSDADWGFALFSNGNLGLPDIYPDLKKVTDWPTTDLFPSLGIPAFP